jgi:hypothetical protein
VNKMNRSIRSTVAHVFVLHAFALTLLITPAAAVDFQESGSAEQRKRDPEALTFTQIDFPGAMLTAAFGINDRDQIMGVFADAGGYSMAFSWTMACSPPSRSPAPRGLESQASTVVAR